MYNYTHIDEVKMHFKWKVIYLVDLPIHFSHLSKLSTGSSMIKMVGFPIHFHIFSHPLFHFSHFRRKFTQICLASKVFRSSAAWVAPPKPPALTSGSDAWGWRRCMPPRPCRSLASNGPTGNHGNCPSKWFI